MVDRADDGVSHRSSRFALYSLVDIMGLIFNLWAKNEKSNLSVFAMSQLFL